MADEANKQQLIELLKPVLKLAKRLKHHIAVMGSIAVVVEHWLDMLHNDHRWWKEDDEKDT